MSKKDNVILVTSALLTAVSIIHLLRAVTGVSLVVAGVEISIWANVAAFLITGILAILNCKMLGHLTKAHWLKWFMWLVVADALVCFYSWVAGLSYWGFSNTAFGWIVVFDIVVIIILGSAAKKSSSQMMSS